MDIIDIVRNQQSRGGGNNGGGNNKPSIDLSKFPKFGFGAFLLFIILLTGIRSSFYTVEPEELGIVLRFGKFIKTSEPGLHFKIPFGIDSVSNVPVQRQLKEQFGFREQNVSVRTTYSSGNYDAESLMLTADLNAADVEWVVQYRIIDAEKFLFKVKNIRQTLRHMSEAIMREVIGDQTINEVLTVGRQNIEDQVETKLQSLTNQYEMGVQIEQVALQNVTPPDPVKPAFDEVNKAQQEMDEKKNNALSQRNKIIPKAKGEALQLIEEAKGYAIDRVNRSEGDVALFNSLFEEYKKASNITEERLYFETMNKVMPQVKNKVFIDKDVKGVLPLYMKQP